MSTLPFAACGGAVSAAQVAGPHLAMWWRCSRDQEQLVGWGGPLYVADDPTSASTVIEVGSVCIGDPLA